MRRPFPNTTGSQAEIRPGSDKRGTIYGLYDISEQIGVSPWYFMADVPPASHAAIYALDTKKTQASPSVKYRGFFINDEAPALTGWMNANFQKSTYGSAFGADFYAVVFELLLRLRANYLWPAMWGSMFNVDDPRSQPLADEYGVVMGTSHTEPMMRATNEWGQFGSGAWQWNTNNASIYPFFADGAERALPYEGVMTVGMRGSHDTAMSANVETDMLENIVDTQRQILKDVYGSETGVPQVWCLYKEVQGYYEAGMRVPDDVILLWADDNWGNNRRLPVGNETDRSGGAGVYYHFDYVGDPRNHKWINAVQLEHTWEQMHMAYERGARELWIVNVGDIKPLVSVHGQSQGIPVNMNRKSPSTTFSISPMTSLSGKQTVSLVGLRSGLLESSVPVPLGRPLMCLRSMACSSLRENTSSWIPAPTVLSTMRKLIMCSLSGKRLASKPRVSTTLCHLRPSQLSSRWSCTPSWPVAMSMTST